MTQHFKHNSGRQWSNLTRFYLQVLLSDWTLWLTITGIIGALLLVVLNKEVSYGASPLPSTVSIMLGVKRFDNLIMAALIIYSSELYWREKQYGIQSILDTYPISNRNILSSKFLSLAAVGLIILAILFTTGITIQLFKGYYQFDLQVYLMYLGAGVFRDMLFFLTCSFFLQTLTQHKFTGIALTLLVLFARPLLLALNIEHPLLYPMGMTMGLHTGLAGFGPFLERYGYFSIYVLSVAGLLFLVTLQAYVRGIDIGFRERLKLLFRTNKAHRLWMMICLTTTLGSAAYIFWNTNLQNNYLNSNARTRLKADYEKQLKYVQNQVQPKLTSVKLVVDLDPENQAYEARGSYVLKNYSAEPIDKLFVQKGLNSFIVSSQTDLLSDYIDVQNVRFSKETHLLEKLDRFNHEIHQLSQPLKPGDSLIMDFEVQYRRNGFPAFGMNTEVLQNGTFISLEHFPLLGYNASFELASAPRRKRFGLPEKHRMYARDDKAAIEGGLNGAYSVTLDITLGVPNDQIAISPGYLKSQWQENGRTYYRYVMDEPIENQYALLAARYDLIKDSTTVNGNPVSLEIYHHPEHTYNTASMMNSLKASLAYFSEIFSPYPYRQARIMEFPGYNSFAVSFPNTIPFSEQIGFMMDIGPEDPDIPFWITAHEMAHQWWGEQVRAGDVEGYGFVVESMAQYAAAILFRKQFGEDALSEIKEHERERYLRGRQNESLREQPLALVQNQPYIHYGKGLLNMYALQHYISEEKVNQALKQVVDNYPGKDRKYVTSAILVDAFRKVTPDSLQYLVTDLFDKIIFMENRIAKAQVNQTDNSSFEIKATMDIQKYEANDLGEQMPVLTNDWLEVAVYGQDAQGNQVCIYRKMHRFKSGLKELKIHTSERPYSIVIDPSNTMMDRDLDNNRWHF